MKRFSQDRTLAEQLSGAFIVFGTLVAAGFLATALTYVMSWLWLAPDLERSRLAVAAEGAAHSAMLDQENGLRGYLLTRDVNFLEPYTHARAALAEANEALSTYIGSVVALGKPLVRTRMAEERFGQRWASAASDTRPQAQPPSFFEGKILFDAYRREHAAFANALDQHATILSQRAQHVVAAEITLVLCVFMVVFSLAVRQHGALRDSIVGPVAALLDQIGRVRDGRLETTVHPAGPRELRQLGEGLNEMVRELVAAQDVAASRETALREHSVRLRQILDATREFSESLQLKYVVAAVRQSAAAVGGYEQVIMWLMDDEEKQLVDSDKSTIDASVSVSSSAPATVEMGRSLAGRAAKSGRITVEDPNGQVRFCDSGAGLIRAFAIPLIVGARVVGALEARHARAQVATQEVIEILEMLARHAATAIESARLHEVIEQRSRTDVLTRLFNRRKLDEDLEAECQRCMRYGRPLAFVMLDVDHFKEFNDVHGHPRADIALQQLAGVILGCLRTTDTAYRYGGEEFCVLMRETSAEDAMHFAERARHRIEQRFASGEMLGVTASFGVAGFSADTPLPGALIEAADAALYKSKQAGRNRVMLSSRPRRSSIPSVSSRIS
jgi:diguanylate cyclase (GGDEF)-like protein